MKFNATSVLVYIQRFMLFGLDAFFYFFTWKTKNPKELECIPLWEVEDKTAYQLVVYTPNRVKYSKIITASNCKACSSIYEYMEYWGEDGRGHQINKQCYNDSRWGWILRRIV